MKEIVQIRGFTKSYKISKATNKRLHKEEQNKFSKKCLQWG